jgi:hypothetical protein
VPSLSEKCFVIMFGNFVASEQLMFKNYPKFAEN